MSPEQVRGQPVSASSDIFSLGCVLYELLTGRRSFGRPTAAASMAAILTEEPPDFPGTPGHLPIELQRLVRHCLEKECQLRFHSAHDLVFALRNLDRPQEAAQASVDSVAVLPFSNAGGPDTEYLSDGITESLINNFAAIPQLRVVPRSVAFRYKGRDVDPQEVGRELNVRVLLTGKVLQRGERLSVQAELVDTVEQKQVWGERFNRTFSDIFEVEEEIARQISDQLRMKLTGEDRRRLGRRFTENTTAYQLYLKGRHHWSKRTPESLKRSIECFQEATDEDPRYALAYAGMADGHITLGWYGQCTPAEALERSERAALKAVEIDPGLAEGFAALGFAKGCDRDWAAAEEAFQRAIQLNPNCWLAYDWYAICLSGMGRCEEGILPLRREPSNFTFPFGAHLCVSEIDRETGAISIRRYVAVDDCGNLINPLLVEGQIHGGIVQSLGQALYEHAVYDDNGQLVTGELTDYAIPKAAMVPWIETASTVTPSPVNPLGVKGVGEAGTIGCTPAIVNSVVDALNEPGVRHVDMPLVPEKVWKLIRPRFPAFAIPVPASPTPPGPANGR